MSLEKLSVSQRLFRLLLRVLPLEFRTEFGGEMEDLFRAQRAGVAREGGAIGMLRLWWDTIVGIFTTAPREHLAILRQDVGYALRMMRANLGYTIIAVTTLALGIGANTALYSVIHAVLLKPLPYRQGDQLVVLRQQAPKLGEMNVPFSVTEIKDYREQNSSLGGLVEYHTMTFTLLGHGEARRVRTGVVSAEFFDLFGVRPILGRTFVPADDQPGAPAVLELSFEYWQKFLGGDPGIIGKTFEMNDRVHTVIGVLPPVPQYPNENDVYMPTSACPFRSSPQMIAGRDHRMMRAFGRLKQDATLEQSRADLGTIASRLRKEYPQYYPESTGYTAVSIPLQQELTRQAQPALIVLLAASCFVLLIACANVANLTLSRMARRERELMIRSALGANRSRLFRQLVTESLLMALLAGALGLLFASGCLDLLIEFVARLTPRAREIRVDGSVLLFTLLAALGTSLIFGSISAFQRQEDMSSGLKEGGGQATTGRKGSRVRNLLIVGQVAFSIILLIGAGLMTRSLIKLQSVDPGFVAEHVLTMAVDLNWSKYKTGPQSLDFSRRFLEKVRNEPGVVSVAISSSFPLDPDTFASGPSTRRFQVEGRPLKKGELGPESSVRAASPDYFKALGIPLLSGRAFSEADDGEAPLVALASRSMVRRHWGSEDPLNKKISFDAGKTWLAIVGIVGDVKEFGLDKPAGDCVYVPIAQNPSVGSVLVRTNEDPMSLAGQVRRTIRDLDPEIAVTNVESLEQARSDTLTPARVMTDLLALFALLALLISATGIGGILALSVSQRVHEIGVRMALGARSVDVLRLIVGRGMVLVLLGAGLGLSAALALTDLLRSLLYEVTPTDPLTFSLAAGVIGGAALIACYLPARRATGIDPLVALRHE
ncbi:MAG TPA: ABC transporter permease [Acidobacteriota bacterium]|nr:ABC transporter permease [Acidobacteriota bacterium]